MPGVAPAEGLAAKVSIRPITYSPNSIRAYSPIHTVQIAHLCHAASDHLMHAHPHAFVVIMARARTARRSAALQCHTLATIRVTLTLTVDTPTRLNAHLTRPPNPLPYHQGHAGGEKACCGGAIRASGRLCNETGTPCILDAHFHVVHGAALPIPPGKAKGEVGPKPPGDFRGALAIGSRRRHSSPRSAHAPAALRDFQFSKDAWLASTTDGAALPGDRLNI